MSLDLRKFGQILVPILLAFVSSRLITQTDLLMLAPLGQESVGAYSIPARIMLVDMIVALALGPILSVSIAKAITLTVQREIVRNSISLGLYLGAILAAIGLLIYPLMVQAAVESTIVAELARGAILYLTLAIPVRLTLFIGLMLLYGAGRGREITPFVLFSIVLNAGLNWLFIYHLQWGFKGSYVATVLTSFFELVVILKLLTQGLSIKEYLRPPNLTWLKGTFRQVGAEWGRLISLQLVNFAMLSLFATNESWGERLSVFAVAMEVQAFLLMPMIATMRAVSIVLAAEQGLQNSSQLYRALTAVAVAGILITISVAGVLVVSGEFLGPWLYGFGHGAITWWQPFIVVMAVTVPIYYLNALQRGAWQSREKFGFLFLVDGATQWLLLIPFAYVGLKLGNPWLTWGGLLVVEISVAVILYVFRDHLNIVLDVEQRGEPGVDTLRVRTENG